MAKKDDKVYEDYDFDFRLVGTDRQAIKVEVVQKFLEEKGGYWKDNVKHVTRYKYFVETLIDGRRIFLMRPTFLNKGIDFQVWVEKLDGVKDKKPSHKDVFQDLRIKNKENTSDFKKLIKSIDSVWGCEEPDKALISLPVDFKAGYSPELLLKILKWLFIEQDITYWNYDGRCMLKMAIDKEFNQ